MSIINTILNHTVTEKISQCINKVQIDELPVLVIKHPTCQAAIALQGAHLLFWQPTAQELANNAPVLWLSDKSQFKSGVAIRGGVPICWPWFGTVSSPSHGFARNLEWTLTAHKESEQGVEISLSLQDSPATKAYWPHAFKVEVTIKLGTTCEINLSSFGDYSITSALHTYFGISDIDAITVTGLGNDYIERLAQENLPKIVGEMTFDQEVDRIYTHPEDVAYIKDQNRTIKITHYNHSDVVTWSPWIDRAKSIADLDDESYKTFVCVETCRIHQPIVAKNDTHSYGVKIEVLD